MELKVLCGCGQKFKFDVEPVNGQMPFTVNCPVCGVDGTAAANTLIAGAIPTRPPPPPIPPTASRLQVNSPVYTAGVAGAPQAAAPANIPMTPRAVASKPKEAGEFNLGLGILGAFIGALVGVGVMYGFYLFAGFRFPLLGVGTGLLTGYGAKLLYKGTATELGAISGGIALVAVVASLYLMYGEFPILSIISVAVSVSVAYRIAAN